MNLKERNSALVRDIWSVNGVARAASAIKDFVQKRHHPCEKYGRLNKGQLINVIKHGVLFVFVECDIKVPDHLRGHFEEMTPIFKNMEVQLEDIGEFMEKFANDNKINQAPRCLLIESYFGEKICLATPLVITKIYKVVEYTPVAAFKDFTVEVANARLQGDSDQRYALIAELTKLIGNSSCGRTITDKMKHRDLCFADEHQIRTEIMDPNFYNLSELKPGFYEFETNQKRTFIGSTSSYRCLYSQLCQSMYAPILL